ncbi:MAG: nucleotidyltransferase family protein [Planctomycetaceae bacterium]
MSHPAVFAVVLAAGAGSRFGAQKLVQEYRGAALVRRAMGLAEAACGERSVLVTGHAWKAVFDASGPLRGFLVLNNGYREGIASSIVSGVRAVRHVADAILLLLADQPLVTAAHLRTVLARWEASREVIVATAFSGTAGPPALLPAHYFDRLLALRGDRGARAIIAGAGARLRTVPFGPAAVDVDRPDDLVKLP